MAKLFCSISKTIATKLDYFKSKSNYSKTNARLKYLKYFCNIPLNFNRECPSFFCYALVTKYLQIHKQICFREFHLKSCCFSKCLRFSSSVAVSYYRRERERGQKKIYGGSKQFPNAH